MWKAKTIGGDKMEKTAEERKYSLWVLAWPIFIELFLVFLLGTVDTLMVSRISDDAVAVVGFSNQLFNALMTLFMLVASGAGILIAQKLGARKESEARIISAMAVNVTGVIGLLVSLLLIAKPLLFVSWLSLPEELHELAKPYIMIVGGGMVLVAVMSTLGNVIRSTGNTKGPMYVGVGVNIIHIVLNYAFIFGAFGFPELGLTGVAISTTFSRFLGIFVLIWMFVRAFEVRITWKDMKVFDRRLFKEVLHIGWPLGVNQGCWVLTQLLMFSFVAMMGKEELATRTYMNTMESFCFTLGWAIAMAVQIKVAHLYGAGRSNEAYRSAYQAMWIGLVLVTVNALVLGIFGSQILGAFTNDSEIIALGIAMLWLNLLLQPAKMVNMAIGNSLNAVGDTRFTMMLSMTSMWLVATLLSYVLGIQLGWGLVAIYIAMTLDESLRGAVALWRWRGRKYLNRAERPQEVDSPQVRTKGATPALGCE